MQRFFCWPPKSNFDYNCNLAGSLISYNAMLDIPLLAFIDKSMFTRKEEFLAKVLTNLSCRTTVVCFRPQCTRSDIFSPKKWYFWKKNLRTLQCFQNFYFFLFCPWKIEKTTQKSCSESAQTPFSHGPAQATAHSPKLIFHIMKLR